MGVEFFTHAFSVRESDALFVQQNLEGVSLDWLAVVVDDEHAWRAV